METIKEQDAVILYFSKSYQKQIIIEKNSQTQTHIGVIYHNDLINQPFNISLQLKNTTIRILKPNISLFISTLKRKTQILFEADISLIIYFLNIKKSSSVLECGTGSGALTYSISQQIGEEGVIHTYEVDLNRYEHMLKEIEYFPFKNIKITNCDIITCDKLPNVDCIFLDIPNPWIIIEKCHKALFQTGRICVFIPSFDQAQKVIEKVKLYFNEIKMYENVKREYTPCVIEVENNIKRGYGAVNMQYQHTGYLIFGSK
ncbi:catalytic subunit TRMT61 of tRNA (adenine(58)-N(1))-methyltransferase [Hamiltosporidium magnivora]|uniref:tRNA (adenine(58)-N(1))-methyltransferase catalytic subunit TRM61 n=1 Tax=Hamiltosporidium magnivora TaxID=148818 RepID=A0A4Q9LJ10_9MICR|nr:catalytic subunit TRMT61 of tRNA (adenine(58)-N(1))-methyltransferase [Hamiltosporidium magnivora]TBU08821.1 catalytic subunit TRMT61 of tRNA (adenine(58)-N(1))-methyltransferase [Hamiltosporidium magnivora]